MMKKKQYSSAEVENLLQGVVEQARCQMDEAMEERIVAHIGNVARKYRRRQRYKRAAVLTLPVLLLGVSVPLLYHAFTPSHEPGSVVFSTHTQQEGTEADPVRRRRINLGNIDGTLESGFSPAPRQSYNAGGGQRYGASLQGACEYTACTDTI